MARETIVRHTDDIDGTTLEAPRVETIGFRGFVYELDLTDEHADELAADIEKWIQYAHAKVKWPKRITPVVENPPVPIKKVASKRASTLTPEQRKEARQWGRDNGYRVADRGYLSPDLEKAYKKATRPRTTRAKTSA